MWGNPLAAMNPPLVEIATEVPKYAVSRAPYRAYLLSRVCQRWRHPALYTYPDKV